MQTCSSPGASKVTTCRPVRASTISRRWGRRSMSSRSLVRHHTCSTSSEKSAPGTDRSASPLRRAGGPGALPAPTSDWTPRRRRLGGEDASRPRRHSESIHRGETDPGFDTTLCHACGPSSARSCAASCCRTARTCGVKKSRLPTQAAVAEFDRLLDRQRGHDGATLQARFGPAPGHRRYSPAPRRRGWRTARAFASAWRRRSNF